MPELQRVFLIILDGVGAGAAPDAAAYGDDGSNTLSNTARAVGGLRLPNLGALGLGCVTSIAGVPPRAEPRAHVGRMRPASAGKDSTTGHWELMGCVLDRAFPSFPDGFPPDVIARIERGIGRTVLGNRAASGTAILQELGAEHLASGAPIVYTSADSVLQIAAHEERVPVDELYRWCETVRTIMVPPHDVARIIARPFIGGTDGFQRTPHRRDFSLAPPRPTVLDALAAAGRGVLTIGKVDDLFRRRGISRSSHTRDNREGMALTLEAAAKASEDLVFVNLVDFDTMWGHRNDPRAFALGLEEFDAFLADFLPALGPGDLLLITADHGNDPTTPSTDHSREYVPLLAFRHGIRRGGDIGERASYADAGATIANVLGVPWNGAGTPFPV